MSTPAPASPKRLGFFSRVLDQVDVATRYRLVSEQIIHAEAQGFDSAWVAQHHFNGEEGGLPSPLVFLAGLASRTSRIRLGTGVITLPMEDAVRVAEDTAVLDILLDGRLEVGVGTGGTPQAFLPFGLESADRGLIYGQHLTLVRDAWAGGELAGGNRLYPTAPHLRDRVWQATFSVGGGERAGLAGDGLMLSRTQPRPPETPDAELWDLQNPIIDAYLAALPDGRSPRILGSRSLFVADSRKQALHFAEIGLRRSIERFTASGFTIRGETTTDLIKAFDVHVGTPEDVIASLQVDTALARVTDLVFQVHSVDPPHEHILRSLELIAAQVAPALGWTPRAPALSERRFATKA
ncbi:putative FMN-dependent luciferase-like monooxygenase [Rhizobium rhizogenes]|uniref:putative FMN-dependent luciferase-like monooxygenase n=1 Tax=Rhizobium rhizogenes TaxID=359 RepID=UPI0015736BA2|nr:putative FMN-dependent luciferase-like monooxygenase [Rhizobium rhizogenes]NTG02868.1 putative FMN-dependent luciferase-like monooxygenase [Rhizobium rhizogenes]NTG09931.1 putative FMN-dependent luciferase-like monooxygenase [Rhizobium rhizogenes]NTG43483.1 putative FMN-dependent luciferase-like monooxygenase [Rhizobium rhizogenes]NTJ34640.1 putative FMN-dependent luciferase-like monooxygenase [Rhizobium rhizogenes]